MITMYSVNAYGRAVETVGMPAREHLEGVV
ncbi:hypothetical protein SAMN06269185_1792 [Natronoarchaeum philippinense]|uniref:Uncharacterized protein n=1 Tax=Natronoarchaeum philippinense TaxID=558529 RepID=A0A285NY06_NATPI|nr:hypothetical protein SAMN06269185_1792 [Natronoarchaeum philippinense]